MAGDPVDIDARLQIAVLGCQFSAWEPVDLHTPGPETNSEKVDPGDTSLAGQPSHVASLGHVHGVDRVAFAGNRPDLYGHRLAFIRHEQVDFPSIDIHVPGERSETLFGEPPRGEPFPGGSHQCPGLAQRFNSVFSSFSTLTSRKVRT